ncbi:hypothetical protein M569_08850 [Genlisea aurea]|uniref:Uncharacterized protein n=1 Tax=Genlisea aurea TaxID=192259 RepID=S8CGI8_9LAMI|nr:hypothetical protein M569_08850 [Genlisea aurea]
MSRNGTSSDESEWSPPSPPAISSRGSLRYIPAGEITIPHGVNIIDFLMAAMNAERITMLSVSNMIGYVGHVRILESTGRRRDYVGIYSIGYSVGTLVRINNQPSILYDLLFGFVRTSYNQRRPSVPGIVLSARAYRPVLVVVFPRPGTWNECGLEIPADSGDDMDCTRCKLREDQYNTDAGCLEEYNVGCGCMIKGHSVKPSPTTEALKLASRLKTDALMYVAEASLNYNHLSVKTFFIFHQK